MFFARVMTIVLAASTLIPTRVQAEETTATEKPTYTLRYQFKTGDVIGYQIKSFDRNKMEKGAFSESSQNRSDYRNHIDVVEVSEDGSATLEVQIDHAIMETKFNDNPPVLFDSADPSKQPSQFWQILDSIGKPSSRAKISPSGELISIQNLRPDPKHPERPLEPAKQDSSQNFLVRLPEKPISVGETWTEDYLVTIDGGGLPLPLKMRRSFTLTKVEAQIASISMKTSVLSPINSPEIEGRIIQQAPSCTIEFDIAKGQISKRSWKVDKVVIGCFGADTSFKVVSLRQDALLPKTERDSSQSTASVK